MTIPWTLPEIIAFHRMSKLCASEFIKAVNGSAGYTDAVQRIGVIEFDALQVATELVVGLERDGFQCTTYWDAAYPERLRILDQPPPILYHVGPLPHSALPSVAVVGTRRCTIQYGKPATEMLVREWVNKGIVIVSGLANGIDIIAHETCVQSGGCTVAVIASGLKRVTPLAAQKMIERLLKIGGCVVTEYAPMLAAIPPNFPARNRIISGLSDAVVVVESNVKGGALITADFAIKQGKPLYALPGPILSVRSAGTNNLIKRGLAELLQGAEDIYASLDLDTEMPPSKVAEDKLINWPQNGANFSLDELAEYWVCSVSEALGKLLQFEFSGAVKQLPGKRFESVR
ncbi:MAG: DNA-protecting protein DprA [Ignavibacteria bacterium]|nr:DNA-protecting protein DprA [Ignavibacteria bacterium]